MIKLLRLDERLIHGQVAIKWSRHTSVNRIVVIDDDAANNPIIQKSLMMAAPNTVKVAIKGIEAGIKLLNDPRCEEMKILVVTGNLENLLQIIENVKDIPLVNIGNYGRIAPKVDGKERKAYRSNLYAYPQEVDLLKTITSKANKVVYQTVPDDTPEEILTIIK